jgi:hypothetical protein
LSISTKSIEFEVPKCSPKTEIKKLFPRSSSVVVGKGIGVNDTSNGEIDKLGVFGNSYSGEEA